MHPANNTPTAPPLNVSVTGHDGVVQEYEVNIELLNEHYETTSLHLIRENDIQEALKAEIINASEATGLPVAVLEALFRKTFKDSANNGNND